LNSKVSEILKRYSNNPILIPDKNNWWESVAVFNCAILYDGKKIHMLYRAIGEYKHYFSRIGYASSDDGYVFRRRNGVAINPSLDYEKFGIEDPRLCEIDNQVYITYVVLPDRPKKGPMVSTALATTSDYSKFDRLGIITNEGTDNKDVVLFPTKLRSKNDVDGNNTTYFCLHRPSSWIGDAYGIDKPSIWIGEGNKLTNFETHTLLMKPEQKWEELKIGAGSPPVRTKYGWLIIYHGVSADRTYSAGAALLDLENPYKILCRSKEPILVPSKQYEKYGDVNNVVFPTGACIINGEIFVYYGGADKVCCLATAKIDELVDYLFQNN
jgi:predicted GH43/DUF377 family glycosyl hydrolase